MKLPFEPIKLPKKATAAGKSTYRVYSDASNFKLVEAENAAAALKASGMAEARRIERFTPTMQSVLDARIFSEVAAKPPEAKPADAPAPTEQKPEPLSSEDVSQLLQENPPAATPPL